MIYTGIYYKLPITTVIHLPLFAFFNEKLVYHYFMHFETTVAENNYLLTKLFPKYICPL